VLLVVAALAVRRNPRVRTPLALTALLFGVGLYSITRVVGGAQDYAFFWRVPIAIVVVFVTLAALWFRFGFDRKPHVFRATVALLAAIVAFSSVAMSVRIVQQREVSEAEPLARSMLARLHEEHEPNGSVLVRAPDVPFLGLQRTVVNELDRSGAAVRVDPDLGFQFGYRRTATPGQVDQVWYVVESGQYLSVLAGQPGARVLWEVDALPAAQENQLRELQRQMWVALQHAGRTDLFSRLDSSLVGFAVQGVPGISQATINRVVALNEAAEHNALCRCAIVAFPAREVPAVAFP
jgi:hypothetical protein